MSHANQKKVVKSDVDQHWCLPVAVHSILTALCGVYHPYTATPSHLLCTYGDSRSHFDSIPVPIPHEIRMLAIPCMSHIFRSVQASTADFCPHLESSPHQFSLKAAIISSPSLMSNLSDSHPAAEATCRKGTRLEAQVQAKCPRARGQRGQMLDDEVMSTRRRARTRTKSTRCASLHNAHCPWPMLDPSSIKLSGATGTSTISAAFAFVNKQLFAVTPWPRSQSHYRLTVPTYRYR